MNLRTAGLLTPHIASIVLGVSRQRVDQLVRAGRLRAIITPCDHRRLFRAEDVRDLNERRRAAKASRATKERTS